MVRQNETDDARALTDRQLAALPYLVSPSTLSEGARLANLGRATLYRWMEDDRFRQELERLRSHAAELALAELRGMMLKAAQVLAEAMEHPKPHVRVRASQVALALGIKVGELKDLRESIGRIDDALHLLAKRRPST